MARKLGILGGTFNPIHYGHLAAAEEVRNRLKLDKILFIPAFLPPHKTEVLPSAEQRLEMVRLATRDNPCFEPSDIEIKRGGRSFTIDTIEGLQAQYPGAELNFITGLDSFMEIQTWHEWGRLLNLCAFIVISRPGYRFADLRKLEFMKTAEKDLVRLDAGDVNSALARTGGFSVHLEMIPLYDISSTNIRERLREGISIKYLLPEAVETYIIENRLYA